MLPAGTDSSTLAGLLQLPVEWPDCTLPTGLGLGWGLGFRVGGFRVGYFRVFKVEGLGFGG